MHREKNHVEDDQAPIAQIISKNYFFQNRTLEQTRLGNFILSTNDLINNFMLQNTRSLLEGTLSGTSYISKTTCILKSITKNTEQTLLRILLSTICTHFSANRTLKEILVGP